MTTLRAVEAAADLDLNHRVRLVARVLLAMQGMTQLELGRRLGLPATPIRNRLQGRTPFTVAEIEEMSRLFGIPPEAFFTKPSALLGAQDGVVLSRKQPTTHRTSAGPSGRPLNGRVVPRPAREERSVLELLQGAAA